MRSFLVFLLQDPGNPTVDDIIHNQDELYKAAYAGAVIMFIFKTLFHLVGAFVGPDNLAPSAALFFLRQGLECGCLYFQMAMITLVLISVYEEYFIAIYIPSYAIKVLFGWGFAGVVILALSVGLCVGGGGAGAAGGICLFLANGIPFFFVVGLPSVIYTAWSACAVPRQTLPLSSLFRSRPDHTAARKIHESDFRGSIPNSASIAFQHRHSRPPLPSVAAAFLWFLGVEMYDTGNVECKPIQNPSGCFNKKADPSCIFQGFDGCDFGGDVAHVRKLAKWMSTTMIVKLTLGSVLHCLPATWG